MSISALFLLSDNIGLALLLFAIMVIKTPSSLTIRCKNLHANPHPLIYVGIALTGIIYTFRFAPANWSTLISLFIVQILVEIEIKWQKIGLLKSKYDKFHQVLISISTASNAITVALFTYPEFNVSLIFLAIGIVLVGLLYINRIRFRENGKLSDEINQSSDNCCISMLLFISRWRLPLSLISRNLRYFYGV